MIEEFERIELNSTQIDDLKKIETLLSFQRNTKNFNKLHHIVQKYNHQRLKDATKEPFYNFLHKIEKRYYRY